MAPFISRCTSEWTRNKSRVCLKRRTNDSARKTGYLDRVVRSINFPHPHQGKDSVSVNSLAAVIDQFFGHYSSIGFRAQKAHGVSDIHAPHGAAQYFSTFCLVSL